MAADQKEELLKSVKNTLRSVLIPSKEGIPARTIERVYDELACSPLPYRQLGFNSCEEFIRSIPDVVRIGRNKDGGPQLFAVATAATAHIVKMVSAQRNKKVRSKRPVKTPVRRPYNQKPGPPPRPYQSRYGYTGKPAYQSSRPLSRPIGKPFRKPSRPTTRSLYNNNSNMGQPHRSAPSYSAPSGASYTNFAVTVQSNRGGNSVELRYDSDDSENETGKQGRMRSVVVKPALLPNPNLRSQNPNNEEVKFGENFEVPPRLRNSRGGRGEKDHLPSVVERGQLYKKLVIDYCNQKNLQFPDYATVAMKKGYVSSIILEGRSYGSLEPYQTPESAEEATALNACKSLNIEKGLSAAKETEPTQSDQPLTCDPKVKDRIVQIVRRRQAGTWLKRVPVEYKEKYREECPANLLRLLQSWPDLVRAEK
ncbi:tudor domain-containing protein 7-like isoform X2 [Liolophura sinensis]|uniref:tudor domain-containing protein 7-like isoform X2 n=1 Tax=Liolophura sinensis TaxID=3198878 RepID=UPI003159154E